MSGHVGAGIIILGIAAFLFVMGIKGTQHQLFPQIFGSPVTSTTYPPGTPGTGMTPGQGGCPNGYHPVTFGALPICVPNITTG